MAEQLIDQQNVGATEVLASQTAPESFGGRLRSRLRQAGHETYNLLDVAAGVALAKSDLQHAESTMLTLNERFDGMLERQSAPDVLTLALEDDIRLDFRLAAQRAGYTDVDLMPADERLAVAHTAAQAHTSEIISELQTHHPYWSAEQLAEAATVCVRDCAARLAMTATEREDYNAAMLQYQEQKATVPGLQQELTELRAERNDRFAKLGRVAVRSMVRIASAVRTLPRDLSARAVVAGQLAFNTVGNWYSGKSVEGKRAIRYTALGLAVSGLASYIAVRFGMGGSVGGSYNPELVSASDTTAVLPEAATIPNEVQSGAPNIADTIRTHATLIPEEIKVGAPRMPSEVIGSTPVMPTEIKAGAPVMPGEIQAQAPTIPTEIKTQPPVIPEHIGGNAGFDLSGADTSSELFGKGRVEKWPETVRVSAWNAKTKDGSLWGISTELLERSGVKNPNAAQVDQLVDALRPQAQPNGYLVEGQKLDLRPALKKLRSII